MTNNAAAPLYSLRGLPLIGWRDMSHALNYLFADGQLKQGTLVAINAEKLLTAEDNPEVRALIGAAEFKYADGISVVRSIRKKFPQAQVSRVAGADLWEALMARAGKEGTPVFLVGGKPEVLAQTEANCGRSGTSILWVARMVTLRRSSVRRYLRVSMPAARKLSPSRWDRQNRNYSCAIVGKCIPMRYIWGWAGPMMCLPVTSNAPQKYGRTWGWSGCIVCFRNRSVLPARCVCCATFAGTILAISNSPF